MPLPHATLLLECPTATTLTGFSGEPLHDGLWVAGSDEVSLAILALTLANLTVHEANAAIEDAMLV